MKHTEDETATEARDLVRRAVGDASGLTIEAQLRQAARDLGYVADAWRLREALYRRAGRRCSVAIDDLRRRFTAWQQREAAGIAAGPSTLAQRVGEVRRLLDDLDRQVAGIEVEVVTMGTRSTSGEVST